MVPDGVISECFDPPIETFITQVPSPPLPLLKLNGLGYPFFVPFWNQWQSPQWPVFLRGFYWPNYTTIITLDGSTLLLHAPSIASATLSIPSLPHSAEGPRPTTSPVSTSWEDPTGSAPTSNSGKKPSMSTIVKNFAPATLQSAPANVWPSESIGAILVAAPVETLGHGRPNLTCQHPSVPRSANSFAATLS